MFPFSPTTAYSRGAGAAWGQREPLRSGGVLIRRGFGVPGLCRDAAVSGWIWDPSSWFSAGFPFTTFWPPPRPTEGKGSRTKRWRPWPAAEEEERVLGAPVKE